jgi:cation diffusion facilitator CzcD-associated flavoprotein CzcO
VLVFATGFHTTRPPFATRVFGRGGLALSEHWREGMVAHASTTVAGFPNLFVIDGPNASLGHNSAVHMIETQIAFILGALDYLEIMNGEVLEVSREAEDAWVSELDRRSASTVWLTGGCSSWYVDDRSDRLTLLWPDFAFAFRDEVGTFDPRGYHVSCAPVAVAD